MAFPKVQRLISSELSKLAGEFTLSPTVLLRTLHMWESVTIDEQQDKPLARSKNDIARCLAPMFSIPFFQSNTAELSTQVDYHTRFSVEILYKEGLISPNAFTRNLANLCTHLFEIEPANLMLGRLLKSGLLHEYLTDEAKNVRKGDRRSHLTVKLLSVLGWIIYRRRLPYNAPKYHPRKKHLPSEGCPRLPALPPKIKEEIKKYNDSLFNSFQEFAWSVSSCKKMAEQDFTLPLSNRVFTVGWDERGEPFGKDSAFAPSFIKQIVRYRARNPFSAVAGVGDTFENPVDLAKCVRNVLHLDLNAIPTVGSSTEFGEESAELEATNSYILDFMIHGKIKYLWEDNGINATVGWKIISEFVEGLKKLVAVLKEVAPNDDIVLKTTTELYEEMKSYHSREGGK
eukprot:TRINITY_DN3696_c4_g1_i1.p1 TRINITY_DN3696_c4_g1~~TRINITY_DN3696_c4_g1_i1.p1  ORF type:complete len:438 (-),score=81.03 TRINITY_DN3696_c4_g1_i1:137-1336(-)